MKKLFTIDDFKPVYINDDMMNGTFRRNGEGDYHCTREETKAMLRDQAKISPDMKVLEDEEISEFNSESIRLYRLRYATRRPNSAWEKLPDDKFLVQIGAASDKTKDGRIHPTAAGLLMFGQEYRITPQFPEYFLDYREKLDPQIRWTDRVQTQSGDFSGNVFDFFSLVYPKITADFKKPFMTEGPYRIEETPRHLAVREALANCLVNADYYQRWSVVIERYPDRIVLSNPGTIILGKKQMLRGGISEPRNRNIFKMFNLIGIGEHAGSGVPDIFTVWENEGLKTPMVEEQFGAGIPDRTTLILPLIKKEPDISGKSQAKRQAKKADEMKERTASVLDIIRTDPTATAPKIASMLGITERQVRTVLDQMKSQQVLYFERLGRSGRWVLNESYLLKNKR